MIHKAFKKGDAVSEALYSPCMGYRYALTRQWDEKGPRVLFIMLNPSTATEEQNDPTIERCERRARALGFGGFRAVNIFSWRETSPDKLRQHSAPVGPENDLVLMESCTWADQVVCGWGVHGEHQNRGRHVTNLLLSGGFALHCLGTTKAGHPRHPLYIAYKTLPQNWIPDDRYLRHAGADG